MRAVITGVGHYVPEQILGNQDLEKMVDTSDEWILSRTGIRQRRILEKNRGTSFMAAKAAQRVLEQRQISAKELDLIILATVTPDMPVPSAVSLVQKELGADKCWGFDLNGGCSGFLYALVTAGQFIESGKHQKVLVIGADKMSSIIDYQDRNTCVIFGDAAGAVLLEPSEDEEQGIRDFDLHLDGEGAQYLYIPAGGSLEPASSETVAKRKHYVFQDGKAVFKRAVTGMSEVSKQILDRNGLGPEDIKYLIPHQANFRIIDSVAKKLELTSEQVIINIENYGNTTAATIPLAMSEAYEKKMLRRGDWLVLSAFGAGFTWGSVLVRWSLD
ncbi:MAG: beta-ketoacyl-ACP synthase III [Desulfobacterales bacterium]